VRTVACRRSAIPSQRDLPARCDPDNR
jgi:hypothetical protein